VELACYHASPESSTGRWPTGRWPAWTLAELRAAYQMAVLAHGRCLVELRSATETLDGLEHPWLVVKGPVLAEIGYGGPRARLYDDLDLVVAPSDLPSAIRRIEAAGGCVTDLNWPMMASPCGRRYR